MFGRFFAHKSCAKKMDWDCFGKYIKGYKKIPNLWK